MPVFQSSQCGTRLQQYHVDIIRVIGSSQRSSHSPKECQPQHNRLPHPNTWIFVNTNRRRSRVIQIRMIPVPQKLRPITTLRLPLSRRTTLTCHHLPHILRMHADVCSASNFAEIAYTFFQLCSSADYTTMYSAKTLMKWTSGSSPALTRPDDFPRLFQSITL